ncbi:hypothetical protein [Actinomadura sp. NTSP31]|uniref:hypothetical protein n=1 Tax=Actinomadura sp. NTSP31 TaxID=1735447 RepID=UPI0035BF6774
MTDRTEGQPEGRRPERPTLRTGSETPVDPEDLAMAKGQDPTPENVERQRRRIEEKGARRATDEATP